MEYGHALVLRYAGERPVTLADGGKPIDSSGVTPDGFEMEGPADLRQFLVNHPEQFVQTATERLLTYALGRGVEYSDMPVVRQIMRESQPSGYRWSSLLVGVVRSMPFQMRMSTDGSKDRTE